MDGDSKFPITHQCGLLNIDRSKYYRKPKPEFSDGDKKIMDAIDQEYTKQPMFGCRNMRWALKKHHGLKVGKDRVSKLMKAMGLVAQAPKPNTSKAMKEHKKYAYLLRNLVIDKPNHVWGTDITYIRTQQGFCFMVAIIDLFSRSVLSYRISNMMDTSFCIEALEEAIEQYGCPEIFNSDQGSQFTSQEFTQVLLEHQVAISMDGKGRATDNAIVERFWRTLKQECVYPKYFKTIKEVKIGVKEFVEYYNNRRPHQSLGMRSPLKCYQNFTKPLVIQDLESCTIKFVNLSNKSRKSITNKLV